MISKVTTVFGATVSMQYNPVNEHLGCSINGKDCNHVVAGVSRSGDDGMFDAIMNKVMGVGKNTGAIKEYLDEENRKKYLNMISDFREINFRKFADAKITKKRGLKK